MDVSDEETGETGGPRSKRIRTDPNAGLKEENDSLRCQLEAYKNEVEVVRADLRTELENKDKQIKMMQQTLKGMQEQLIEARRNQRIDEQKVRKINIFIYFYNLHSV